MGTTLRAQEHKQGQTTNSNTQRLTTGPFLHPRLLWAHVTDHLQSPALSVFCHEEKEMQACLKYFRSVLQSALILTSFVSSFSLVTLERVCSHPSDSSWFKGSLKDTFWLFKLCLRKGGHVRLSYSPANWAHLPYDTVSLPPSLLLGNPFWPWKSPDPALRVC